MFRLLNRLKKKERHFYSVVAKYGYGEVPAAEVYALFESVSSLLDGHFSCIKPGRYSRPVSDDIFHVVKLQALKGSGYSVWWGVSLTYVPHVQGKRIRWHRTLKSAQLDLFEEPVDYFGLYDKPFPAGTEYFAQNGHGPIYLRETMQKMWRATGPSVHDWLATTTDLPGVLGKAEVQTRHNWRGIGHNPDPRLVHAFTLRQLDRNAEAQAVLDAYLTLPGISPAEAELIRNAFGAPPNPSLQRTRQ